MQVLTQLLVQLLVILVLLEPTAAQLDLLVPLAVELFLVMLELTQSQAPRLTTHQAQLFVLSVRLVQFPQQEVRLSLSACVQLERTLIIGTLTFAYFAPLAIHH